MKRDVCYPLVSGTYKDAFKSTYEFYLVIGKPERFFNLHPLKLNMIEPHGFIQIENAINFSNCSFESSEWAITQGTDTTANGKCVISHGVLNSFRIDGVAHRARGDMIAFLPLLSLSCPFRTLSKVRTAHSSRINRANRLSLNVAYPVHKLLTKRRFQGHKVLTKHIFTTDTTSMQSRLRFSLCDPSERNPLHIAICL